VIQSGKWLCILMAEAHTKNKANTIILVTTFRDMFSGGIA
jgi:hypothetical protein